MDYKEIAEGSLLDWIKEKYLGKLVTDSRSEAGNWLQLTLDHIEPGTAVISLNVRKEMTNPYGMIHGGMMSLVMDEAIGWAIVSLNLDHHYTSLNLNVDFLYAVKEGDRITIKATIIRSGKKIIHAACEVHDSKGRLAGRGASNLVVTGMKLKE